MSLSLCFIGHEENPIKLATFEVNGDSDGWSGSLATSRFTHRHEVVVAPPGATKFLVKISSAGPPSAVGTYIVANLIISKRASNSPPMVLIESPLNNNLDLKNWMADGTRPSMAKVVTLGKDESKRALAILDDDGNAHAEWHNTMRSAPAIAPGEVIQISWDEMFSIGLSDLSSARYASIPAGRYIFRAAEFDISGCPTGNETFVMVRVPQPFWFSTVFWAAVAILVLLAAAGIIRYRFWLRTRRQLTQLQSQNLLEMERLRIARDFHDDLAARITEMSLVTGLAKRGSSLPQSASESFDQIAYICQELSGVLYGTIWMLDPHNDNLGALVDYLCQVSCRLCREAQIQCRLDVAPLPKNTIIDSKVRRAIAIAVVAAIRDIANNTNATEVRLIVTLEEATLEILLQDNRSEVQKANLQAYGHFIAMTDQLAGIGGKYAIRTGAKAGMILQMQIEHLFCEKTV